MDNNKLYEVVFAKLKDIGSVKLSVDPNVEVKASINKLRSGIYRANEANNAMNSILGVAPELISFKIVCTKSGELEVTLYKRVVTEFKIL